MLVGGLGEMRIYDGPRGLRSWAARALGTWGIT